MTQTSGSITLSIDRLVQEIVAGVIAALPQTPPSGSDASQLPLVSDPEALSVLAGSLLGYDSPRMTRAGLAQDLLNNLKGNGYALIRLPKNVTHETPSALAEPSNESAGWFDRTDD